MAEPPPTERNFGSLYQTTLTPLRRYLASVLGCLHEAQDVAHDAYLRTYEAMREKDVAQPKAFLFTTARRLALNFRMRRGSRVEPRDNATLDREMAETPDAVAVAMERQERAALETAILNLPEGCREVLILRNRDGLSHQEISERLGIARSTVEKHLARALRLLREELIEKKEGGDQL